MRQQCVVELLPQHLVRAYDDVIVCKIQRLHESRVMHSSVDKDLQQSWRNVFVQLLHPLLAYGHRGDDERGPRRYQRLRKVKNQSVVSSVSLYSEAQEVSSPEVRSNEGISIAGGPADDS